MRSWRSRIVLLAFLALSTAGSLLGCSTLDEHERRWIFRPTHTTFASAVQAAQGMDDVWVSFDSQATGRPARLHGLWLAQEREDAPVLLYLHGARWDVRGSAARIRRMHDLGFSVLAIDYRGFGLSGDELPSERTAAEDAMAAWQWLGHEHPGAARYIFGHSLGGAIAIGLASRVGSEPAGVMVEGTFTSISDVVDSFEWGWLPVNGLITQRFDSLSKVGEVRAPLLVVHGSADSLIPWSLGRQLYERAATRKQWVLVDGGNHHTTNQLGMPQYRAALHSLFGLSDVPADTDEPAVSAGRKAAPVL